MVKKKYIYRWEGVKTIGWLVISLPSTFSSPWCSCIAIILSAMTEKEMSRILSVTSGFYAWVSSSLFSQTLHKVNGVWPLRTVRAPYIVQKLAWTGYGPVRVVLPKPRPLHQD